MLSVPDASDACPDVLRLSWEQPLLVMLVLHCLHAHCHAVRCNSPCVAAGHIALLLCVKLNDEHCTTLQEGKASWAIGELAIWL